MPEFTIERQFLIPKYRYETYEAADLETALQMDAENDNWDVERTGWGGCIEKVTGAWAGDQAHVGPDLINKAPG